MLKLSKLTDYATVILSYMARNQAAMHAAMDIAKATGIARPTVSKVLKTLSKSGLLRSVRGAKGGYELARMPARISVASVIRAIEGPIALTECSHSHRSCQQVSDCGIQGNWHLINQKILHTLESMTLADLILPVDPPQEIAIPVTSLYR